MVPESFLAKDQCCIFWIMLTVLSKVTVPPCLMLFASLSLVAVEAFDDRGRGRCCSLHPGLSVLMATFTDEILVRPSSLWLLWRCHRQ